MKLFKFLFANAELFIFQAPAKNVVMNKQNPRRILVVTNPFRLSNLYITNDRNRKNSVE